jgi:hypothetical protein
VKPVCILSFLAFALAQAQNVCEVRPPDSGTATAVIQKAIDDCYAKGGGRVAVAPGNYRITTLWIKDNVDLHIAAGATLRLSQSESDWAAAPLGERALIRARGAAHFSLTGRGTIDGQAQYSYGPRKREDEEIVEEYEIARKAGVNMNRWRREGVQAYLVLFEDCEDFGIEEIRLVNSPLWTVRIQDCKQVRIHGIYLYSSPEKAVNGDGVDLVSSSNVLISDSTIISGDDSICLKTTTLDNEPTRPVKPAENIVVNNCILTSSSTPLMIGTESFADMRHIVFSNIVIRDSNKAFGINVQDGATVSDVGFSNITFELNRKHWNWWGSAEVFKFVLKKRTPESKLGRIEHITVDGAQGTARGTSLIQGHPDQPIEHVTLSNLNIRMLAENTPDKRATHAIRIDSANSITLRNVEVEWAEDQTEPKWGSALALHKVTDLDITGFKGRAAHRTGPVILRDH